MKTLLFDEDRNQLLRTDLSDQLILDFTHEKLDTQAFYKLLAVAQEVKISEKIEAMFRGDKINNTEKRSVLHVALRMSED